MPVYCPHCGAENRDIARFCVQCAAPLVQELKCPSCGVANPTNARFCLNCASPLRGSTPPAGLTGQLFPNTTLSGRYVIVQRVGKGGMGAVYQATDARIPGKLWAIKEMSDAALLDPTEKQQAREAFQREAQMLALLDHPNLPKVSDFFSEGGKQYLVMEFIVGKTLEDILEASPGPLPEAQVLNWATQLCDALDYLHVCRPPIIFRDLKPGNVMLDNSGKVKLIDFGVARLFKPGKSTDTDKFGTAGYAPPEQYGKGQTDARSDIYALGVTLHQLLTRYDPALTPFNLPPARNVNPAVSAHIEQVIIKATQPAQANRYQRTSELKAALIAPAQPQPNKPTPVKPLPAPPAPRAAPTVVTQSPIVVQSQNEMTLRVAPGVEMIFVRVPAGEFLMGSDKRQDKEARDDEMPQHRVYLDGYWIGKYPVTNAQYAAFVYATRHPTPDHWQSGRIPRDKENHPIVYVSWQDAAAFCQWVSQTSGQSIRLPTEAEWEKAARGTDGRLYPWGNTMPNSNRLNFNSQVGDTTEVTSYPSGASPYGALDMAGNVWEWAADWYGEKYYRNSPLANPVGPSSGQYRVLRGGSWGRESRYMRSANRLSLAPDNRYVNIGFRCTR